MCVCVCVCVCVVLLPHSPFPPLPLRILGKCQLLNAVAIFPRKKSRSYSSPPPFPGKVIRELVGFDGRGRGREVEGGGGRLKGFLAIFYLTVAVYEPALFCAEFFLPLPERRDVWGWGRDHSGGVRLTR